MCKHLWYTYRSFILVSTSLAHRYIWALFAWKCFPGLKSTFFSVFNVNRRFFVVLFMRPERRIRQNELHGNTHIKRYRIVVFRSSVQSLWNSAKKCFINCTQIKHFCAALPWEHFLMLPSLYVLQFNQNICYICSMRLIMGAYICMQLSTAV